MPARREGDWLVALDQIAGRGRQGREWDSAAAISTAATLVGLRAGDPPAADLALVAGLALIEAVDAAVPGLPLMLKWPNDLLLGGAKLAGILLERSGERWWSASASTSPARRRSRAGEAAPRWRFRRRPSRRSRGELCATARTVAGGEPRASRSAWLVRAHPVGTGSPCIRAPANWSKAVRRD